MERTERPSKIMYYLQIAEATAQRSTCLKNYCGAVIVNYDQIISTGYNGAPRGRKNCIDIGTCYRVTHNIPSGTHYELCLSGDTMIKLANGASQSIRELAGVDGITVYAYDLNTNSIKTAEAINIRKTKYAARLIRFTFADTTTLDCTIDHKLLTADGKYIEAGKLHAGDMIKAMHAHNGEMVETSSMICQICVEDYNDYVYDMEVPEYHNFAVDLGKDSSIFVHNCRSVHGEANAIIDADRSKMLHGTMYIYQYDPIARQVRKNPGCCMMCQRMIINAGIDEVIFADPDGIGKRDDRSYGYRIQKVYDWVAHEGDDPIG